MKAVAQIFLLVVLVLSCTVSTYGQETLWKELYSKTTTLYQQGRYSEAAKIRAIETEFGEAIRVKRIRYIASPATFILCLAIMVLIRLS